MQPTTDVIIIGGPNCTALLGRYGFQVTICESHSIPGAAAHSFQRNGYTFDSGPSLWNLWERQRSLSHPSPSPNISLGNR